MIDLLNNYKSPKVLLTTNSEFFRLQTFAKGKVTIFRNDFHFLSMERMAILLNIMQDLCEQNKCHGLVICPHDISNSIKLKPSGRTVYLEVVNDYNDVIKIINSLERQTIVLVLNFDSFYHNGMCVDNTKHNAEYCMDKLVTSVVNTNLTIIVDSEIHTLTAYKTALFAKIKGEDNILLENSAIIPVKNI